MSEQSWADLSRLKLGDRAAVTEHLSEELIASYASLSRDDNPVHLDAAVARSLGFPRPVGHGMIVVGMISRLIGTRLPGAGSLWISQELEFVAPSFAGDRLEAAVVVAQVSLAAQTVVLRCEVRNLTRDVLALRGTARVKVPPRIVKEVRQDQEPLAALVTGSSRGLGRAIALALGGAGIRVGVHGLSRRSEAEEVASEIEAAGSQAVVLQADLTDSAQVDRLFQETIAAFGRIDILVNNASPAIRRKSFQECEWSDFEPYLKAYVEAVFRLSKQVAEDMKKRRFGRIVNVSSSAATHVPPAQMLPYVTMKSAMAGLSRALAVELGPWNITVNMVSPSLLITEQNADIGDRARQLAAAASPLKRLAELEEVAQAVLYLVSEGAGFTTGVTLPVAGGEIMP